MLDRLDPCPIRARWQRDHDRARYGPTMGALTHQHTPRGRIYGSRIVLGPGQFTGTDTRAVRPDVFTYAESRAIVQLRQALDDDELGDDEVDIRWRAMLRPPGGDLSDDDGWELIDWAPGADIPERTVRLVCEARLLTEIGATG